MSKLRTFVSNLFSRDQGKGPFVDERTTKMLLAAAGNVGGDIDDLLLQAGGTDEQRFVASQEAGLFGIATACWFYTNHYRKDLHTLSLAMEIAEGYCRYFTALNECELTSAGENSFEAYFEAEARSALATAIGAFVMYERHPKQLFGNLSGVLAQRLRGNCGLNLDAELIGQIEQKMADCCDVLREAFRHFLG